MSKVSVIIPVYNSMRTLYKCVDSLLAQSVPLHEIIIMDNGSSDDTPRIADYHPLIRFQDMGTGVPFPLKKNVAAEMATGEYVVFIDSDMALEKDVIAECLEQMHLGCVGVIIPERSIGEGFWAKCKILEKECWHGDSLSESARFMKKKTFHEIGGYDTSLIAAEDMDLQNRLAMKGKCGRTKSLILHDEGRLTLKGTVAKKGFYGQSFKYYQRKYPELSAKQFGIRRAKAFIDNWDKLIRHPIVAMGMLYMKAREYQAFKKADRMSAIE